MGKKTNLYNHDDDDVHLWANLLNSILTHVASETGITWDPKPSAKTALADEPITVFEGELLGTDEP